MTFDIRNILNPDPSNDYTPNYPGVRASVDYSDTPYRYATGMLTTEHPASSYGQAVFVPFGETTAYGPGDVVRIYVHEAPEGMSMIDYVAALRESGWVVDTTDYLP